MSRKVYVELDHAFLCANKSCNCVDIGPNNIVSFGSSNSVVLYQPFSWKNTIIEDVLTFNYHKGKVLCTKWMKSFQKTSCTFMNYLLTGSIDSSVAIWQYDNSASAESRLKFLSCLNGHTDSVTAINCMFVEESSTYLIVTSSTDSSIKIWSGTELSSIKLLQNIDLGNTFVLDVALHFLPYCGVPILACACDDFKVKLYVLKTHNNETCFNSVLHLKGHEDWVRGVDFITVDNDTIYLASCSQDSFIRLWKIIYGDGPEPGELKMKKHYFGAVTNDGTSHQFSVAVDAVLSGHENWVYSARWKRKYDNEIVLLSSSIDKTVLVWNFDVENQLWVDSVRVGEIGGNTLGFYGAHFSSDCEHILAHSYTGALHGWDRTEKNSWHPGVVLSGHSASVNDISWEPVFGRYLVSVSEDQTTRLFGKWKKNKLWHEIARPQIHGYDMQCLALINSFKFVSGGDEKVLRVFEAPQNFMKNFEKLSGFVIDCSNQETPVGATVPALGLSNKAVSQKENLVISDRREQYIENLFSPIELIQPPPESYLLQNTLWPEMRKVYGHVYELFCVACSHSGAILASAAKSSQPKHSNIIIWNVGTWKQANSLSGHTLTVTQLEFSPCDRFLLSVSRDRSWILHQVTDPSTFEFKAVAKSEKKTGHSRIIWSCSWSPDSKLFATASRDKKVAFWHVPANDPTAVSRISLFQCNESATAVAFSDYSTLGSYNIAVGLESGLIKLLNLSSDYVIHEMKQFNCHLSHCLSVKRLKWKPTSNETNSIKNTLFLASAGQDNQVKMFKITFFV